MDQSTPRPDERKDIGFAEFVTLIAAIMSLTALGIDAMLPALPAIGDELRVIENNHRQYVITAFLLGFSVAQLIHGPLSDRYGRRPVLIAALGAYMAFNLIAAFAGSFELLLIARFLSGGAVAAGRVVAVALVRDRYAGRAMARVMSLAFIVFMAAPVIAPAFGQFVLLFADWRWIFGGIGLVSGAVLIWFAWRMPETLARESRVPLELGRLIQGYAFVVRDRCSTGYTIAAALLSGALFGFIGSIQQIVFEIFRTPWLLTPLFALIAGTMAIGSFLNSRIVMRLGTRRISHSALAMMIVLAAIHVAIAASGNETIWSFAILQALTMACFGLANTNFSAMAMERMGHIAGTASSLQGFVATLGGAVIGAVIGQAFDGTTVPLYTGFLVTGLLAAVVIAITERGRLFRPS